MCHISNYFATLGLRGRPDRPENTVQMINVLRVANLLGCKPHLSTARITARRCLGSRGTDNRSICAGAETYFQVRGGAIAPD